MKFFTDFIKNLTLSGLEYFGLYYSIYPAYVYNVEDPEGLNRIQLTIPMIDIRVPLSTWAMPKHVFAGTNYGTQCLPQKGDTVWVEFEFGRLKNPVWSHGFWGKEEKPEEFKSTKVYGFKSPAGHYVTIDDENSIIRVTQSNGVSIVINKEGYFIAKDESKLQPLVLGDELQTQLNAEKARVTGIINAIKNATPIVDNSGAGLQASIVLGLTTLQEPDYSNIKSEIGKIE